MSQGNVAVATGRPALAGPYQTFVFTGTLTSGSATVAGITQTSGLAAGDIITGAGIPAGTTIASVDNTDHTLTLSANATASGTQSLSAADPTATPDPDLLMATTYGEGAFAINLAPMLLTGTTQVAPTDTGGAEADGTPIVTTAAPTIDGLSEMTAFGSTTWISIYDETPGDATYGKVIGGFNPQQYKAGNGITPGAGNSTDTFGNFAIPIAAFASNSTPFTGTLTTGSAVVTGLANVKGLTVGEGVTGTGIPAGATIKSINPTADTITLSAAATASGSQGLIAGLKTIKVVATDDAGSQSQPLTLSFVLNANDLSHPAPTSAPPAPFLELTPVTPPYATINNIPVTNNSTPTLDGTSDPGTSITVTETWTNAPGGPQTMSFPLPASDLSTVGTTETFSFAFQDFPGNSTNNGTYSVVATATYTQSPYSNYGPSANSNPPVVFQIDNTTPASVSDFRLNPVDDTGIRGDDVTTDRTPLFIGTTAPGDTVDLLINGQSTIWSTATAIPGFTGNLTVGSATVTNLSGTTELAVGQVVSGTGIPAGTKIAGINATAGTLTLSNAATATAAGDSLTADNVDANGKPYNFSIQLPFTLTEGQTSLYVEVVNLAGNTSGSSNNVGVAIVSNAADYNGGPASDPALFARNTASSQLQWIVQTPAGSAPPWFGASGTPYSPATLFNGTLTSGSAVITGISSTGTLVAGQSITGTGIPAGTTIAAVNSSSSITLSSKATAGGTESLTATAPTDVVPFTGDFDGDGVSDLAYYNAATATWTLFESSNYAVNGPMTFSMASAITAAGGTLANSMPVVGNFDANGPTEVGVFTVNAQGQGIWIIDSSLNGIRTVNLGSTGDIPVPGDYDAIGYDEPAVYVPSNGEFVVYNPKTGTTESPLVIPGISSSPDLASLVPVPGQYDNVYYFANATNPTLPFSGRTEAAVFDPKTGVFTILGPGGTPYTVSGFQAGDIPAPADYLGQGQDQVVVYRPGTSQFIEGSKTGQMTTLATLGGSGDIPLSAPLSYRFIDPPSTSPNPTGDPTGGGGSGNGGGGSTGGGSTGGGSTGGGSTGSGGSSNGGSTSNGGTGTNPTTPPQSGQSPTPPVPVTVSKHHHKKVVTKKAHPTKPKAKKTAHAKKAAEHTVKKVVHVVPAKHHAAVARPAVAAAGSAASKVNLVDMALETVHVNLRRSHGGH